MAKYMPTTLDNPFDPFTEWDDWLRFDEDHGYFTYNLIARLAHTNPELPSYFNEWELERVTQELVTNEILNPYGLYIKAVEGETELNKMVFELPKELRRD